MRLVLASDAVLAASYVSALLLGAGVLALTARAVRQLRDRAGRCVLPPVAGELEGDRPMKDIRTLGPEFASGEQPLAHLIVLRHAPEIPLELHADVVEGRWWDLAGAPYLSHIRCPLADGSIAVAAPSGRFEVDGAGRVAEVWELASPEWAD